MLDLTHAMLMAALTQAKNTAVKARAADNVDVASFYPHGVIFNDPKNGIIFNDPKNDIGASPDPDDAAALPYTALSDGSDSPQTPEQARLARGLAQLESAAEMHGLGTRHIVGAPPEQWLPPQCRGNMRTLCVAMRTSGGASDELADAACWFGGASDGDLVTIGTGYTVEPIEEHTDSLTSFISLGHTLIQYAASTRPAIVAMPEELQPLCHMALMTGLIVGLTDNVMLREPGSMTYENRIHIDTTDGELSYMFGLRDIGATISCLAGPDANGGHVPQTYDIDTFRTVSQIILDRMSWHQENVNLTSQGH